VSLSYSDDGFVHFGDNVMLYSVATEGVLSVDTIESVSLGGSAAYPLTTSTLIQGNVARNTFIIDPLDPKQQAEAKQPLCYGQKFRLRMSPVLADQAFYLHSQPCSHLSHSKVSRKQEVVMKSTTSSDTVWRVETKDIGLRFGMEGENIPTNSEFILVHCPTGQALASDKHIISNDFGQEFEVCGHSHLCVRKKQILHDEQMGITTSDLPSRTESTPNHWAFLTAAEKEVAEPLEKSE